VVDDSKVARMLLVQMLESDPRIRVIDAVESGQAALEFLEERRPDVVLMDIQMRVWMVLKPRAVSWKPNRYQSSFARPLLTQRGGTTFRSMEAGAVACLEKPFAPEHPHHREQLRSLLETIKLMSEVKVVRRWPRSRSNLR